MRLSLPLLLVAALTATPVFGTGLGDADADRVRGLDALRRGDWRLAVDLEERASQERPSDARTQSALAQAYGAAAKRAVIFLRIGYARRCLEALERAVELEPTSVPYRQAALTFYLQAPAFVGGSLKKAEAEAAAIAKLDPGEGQLAFAAVERARKLKSS